MNHEQPSIQNHPAVSAVDDYGELAPPVDAELLINLVIANHILFKHRVVDAFGHVSVRHNKDPQRFLLAKNMAPGLVTEQDIIEYDLAGDPVNAKGRAVYLERFIHGRIYQYRPDVMAVIHSHSPAVIPFGVVKDALLKPVWHMSGFLGQTTPVFEIRNHAGDHSDLLIRSNNLGDALAKKLGSNDVVLMRGHGATVVGQTLQQAVYQSVYTQANAELQFQSVQLGQITFLTEGECDAARHSVGSQVDRAWDLWKKEIEDP